MTETQTLDSKTFAHWAYLAIKKHFKKTIKYETDVLKDRDPEALHQMRVGMRRLRTAVTGFAPALLLPKAAEEKRIAKVAQRLGELRDLDVLQEALQNQYLPTLPAREHNALKKVLATLEKQRRKSLEEVQTTLSQQRYEKLKQALKDWLEEPTYGELAEVSIYDILPDLLLPPISKLFLDPAWLVGIKSKDGEINVSKGINSDTVTQLLKTQGDSLHSLRKQAKRVRYQMELFTEFYGPKYEEYLQDIQEIQRILGQMQDSFVLAEFLTNTLNSEMTDQLPTLATQLSESRYQAWQEWQPLQQRYLNSQIRRDLHQTVLQPISPGLISQDSREPKM